MSWISIPTGAIKRGYVYTLFLYLNSISIPTGAIKRRFVFFFEFFDIIFQFLLVRLKAHKQFYLYHLYKQISIPTGAIKSQCWI